MIKSLILKIYYKCHRSLSKQKINSNIIRKLNKSLVSLLKQKSVVIEGHKIYLDKYDSMRLSTRKSFDQQVIKAAKLHIKEGDVVVDVGANIGYYTLLFAKLVGPSGKVYAFEPHPENFQILKKNILENGYRNVILEKKAVSSKNGIEKLYIDKDMATRHSFLKSFVTTSKFVEVDTITLDSYFGKKKVDFVKIDVEGYEFQVLKGMNDLMDNKEICIITEFTPWNLKQQQINPNEFVNFFTSKGFGLYEINEQGRFKFSLNDALRKATMKKTYYTNIIAKQDKQIN